MPRIGGWDVALQGVARMTDQSGLHTEDLTLRPRARVPAEDDESEESSCPRRHKPAGPSRAELRAWATEESGFERLIGEANRQRYLQPDLAEEALRLAEGLVDQSESAQEKAARLVSLVQAYMGLDGEVDSDRWETAFAAVAQASLDATQPTDRTASDAEGRPIAAAPSDESLDLEARLFALLGRTDMRRALERARALPTEPRRLMAMLAILEAVGVGDDGC